MLIFQHFHFCHYVSNNKFKSDLGDFYPYKIIQTTSLNLNRQRRFKIVFVEEIRVFVHHPSIGVSVKKYFSTTGFYGGGKMSSRNIRNLVSRNNSGTTERNLPVSCGPPSQRSPDFLRDRMDHSVFRYSRIKCPNEKIRQSILFIIYVMVRVVNFSIHLFLYQQFF